MVVLIWRPAIPEPTVPTTVKGADVFRLGVVVITGEPAEAMVMVRLLLNVPVVVVAEMLTGKLPLKVGVPVIWPLPALKLSPVGKVPVKPNALADTTDAIW